MKYSAAQLFVSKSSIQVGFSLLKGFFRRPVSLGMVAWVLPLPPTKRAKKGQQISVQKSAKKRGNFIASMLLSADFERFFVSRDKGILLC